MNIYSTNTELMEDLKNIKVILWDIDGTVLNFYESQKSAIRVCFDKFGIGRCSDEMLNDYDRINHKYWQALERGEITKPEVLIGRFMEFFEKYDIDTSIVDAFNDEYQIRLGDTIVFYPGVMELIMKFKKDGLLQYAITNGTKVAQKKKLASSGLDAIFDDVFISEDIGYEKPDPRIFEPIYREVMGKCPGIKLDEILIIGDSLTSDIKLGNNVGIRTCLFDPKRNVKEADLRIDICVDSFEMLTGMFSR